MRIPHTRGTGAASEYGVDWQGVERHWRDLPLAAKDRRVTDRVFGQFRFGKAVFQHVKEGEVSCDAAGALEFMPKLQKTAKGEMSICVYGRWFWRLCLVAYRFK